jgi:hypothetical protein
MSVEIASNNIFPYYRIGSVMTWTKMKIPTLAKNIKNQETLEPSAG